MVKQTQVVSLEPPAPPSELTEKDTVVWRRLSQSYMVEYGRLPEFVVLLVVEYCRHKVKADHVALLIQRHEKTAGGADGMDITEEAARKWEQHYGMLFKMAERESHGMATQSALSH